MKKRFLAMFLALVMCLALLPTAALAADSDFTIEDGVLTKYNGPGGDVVIPSGVTAIQGYAIKNLPGPPYTDSYTETTSPAFAGCTTVTSVTIPDGVTSIGVNAFAGCTNLTSVKIPDSVTDIGSGAFCGCTSLKSISIPDGVTAIHGVEVRSPGVMGGGPIYLSPTFSGCTSLTTVEIPDSVEEIGQAAFSGCSSLTSVKIPDGVTVIMDSTFDGCSSLASVTIPDSVTIIGEKAFRNCASLTSVTFSDNVTKIKTEAFYGCTGLTNVTIPANGTDIYPGVFYGCTGLTSATISDGATVISGNLFTDCTGLTSVTIPSSVTDIGPAAFYGCRNLMDVYYSGTEAQWKTINIEKDGQIHFSNAMDESVPDSNKPLFNATIHYNSTMPDQSVTPDKPATQFSDVKVGDWYYDAVNWAVEKGITNGTGDGFAPDADCTHDQILTFLWRAAGKPESTAALPFTPKNDWAAGALAWAYEKGMIGEDHDEDAACTSANAVVYIWQAEGAPPAGYDGRFTDVAQDAAYAPAVAWAVDSGVTNGTSDTTFAPAAVCSRARIVTFLQRAFQ